MFFHFYVTATKKDMILPSQSSDGSRKERTSYSANHGEKTRSVFLFFPEGEIKKGMALSGQWSIGRKKECTCYGQ